MEASRSNLRLKETTNSRVLSKVNVGGPDEPILHRFNECSQRNRGGKVHTLRSLSNPFKVNQEEKRSSN